MRFGQLPDIYVRLPIVTSLAIQVGHRRGKAEDSQAGAPALHEKRNTGRLESSFLAVFCPFLRHLSQVANISRLRNAKKRDAAGCVSTVDFDFPMLRLYRCLISSLAQLSSA